jgi:uncharacterized protein
MGFGAADPGEIGRWQIGVARPRFDGQPLIDAYGDNGFRLNGQRFEGSTLLTPRGVYPWVVASLEAANVASLAAILECADDIDFLIVGSGTTFARFPKPVTQHLGNLRIIPDFMDTGAAARTYNILRSEDRRVAAALIAVV